MELCGSSLSRFGCKWRCHRLHIFHPSLQCHRHDAEDACRESRSCPQKTRRPTRVRMACLETVQRVRCRYFDCKYKLDRYHAALNFYLGSCLIVFCSKYVWGYCTSYPSAFGKPATLPRMWLRANPLVCFISNV